MSGTTSIEWTAGPDGRPGKTWNPVSGCSKVSQGCKFCFAEAVAHRFWGARKFTDVQTHADRLDAPLRWRKPARVFVNSMSDLFHEAVPDDFIDRVFAVMALAPQHTFLILTKRPERMRAYLSNHEVGLRWLATVYREHASERATDDAAYQESDSLQWTRGGLDNVWLGVSVEDQATADQRIPLLLQTPAAVRWVSAEPLLGPVLFDNGDTSWMTCGGKCNEETEAPCVSFMNHGQCFRGVDWVVVGGESGQKARDCDVAWIRSIVRQCQATGTSVFVKQLGESQIGHLGDVSGPIGFVDALHHVGAFRKSRKGSDPAEWPEDLRVREFPAVQS